MRKTHCFSDCKYKNFFMKISLIVLFLEEKTLSKHKTLDKVLL